MSVDLHGCLKDEVNSGVGLLCLHLPCLLKIWDVNVRCKGRKNSAIVAGEGDECGTKIFFIVKINDDKSHHFAAEHRASARILHLAQFLASVLKSYSSPFFHANRRRRKSCPVYSCFRFFNPLI
jgi:hypothetical protein